MPSPTSNTDAPRCSATRGSTSTPGSSTSTTATRADERSRAPRSPAHRGVRRRRHDRRGEGDPALVLQGHVDVVPIGDLGEVGGPGSVRAPTISGGIVARARRVRHEGRARGQPRGRACATDSRDRARATARACTRVVSEEDGGLGAFATMLRGHRGDVAVHHRADQRAHRRRQRGRADVPSSRSPDAPRTAATRYEGVSAIEAFLPIHAALARARGASATRTPTRCSRLPAAVPDLDRHGARRRLGEQRARPARRRGPAGRPARRGPRRRARRVRSGGRPGVGAAIRGCATTRSGSRGPAASSPAASIPTGAPAHRRGRERRRRRRRRRAAEPRRGPVRERPPALRGHRRHPDAALRPRRRPLRPRPARAGGDRRGAAASPGRSRCSRCGGAAFEAEEASRSASRPHVTVLRSAAEPAEQAKHVLDRSERATAPLTSW